MKRYGDRGAQMNYAQRFRFGNLLQMYVKYREVFHKRMRAREEGTVPRHFGAAAKAVAAERARAKRLQSKEVVSQQPAPVVCSDPVSEPRKIDQLYGALCEAQKAAGGAADQISRAQFEQFLKNKTEQLRKEKGSRSVEFVVTVENGKARLKARTIS
jgi:hypothetical protein